MPVATWKLALDDPGDITAAPGSIARARALRLKLRELLHDRFRGVQYVLQTLQAFEAERDYAALEDPQGQPFHSVVDFCTAPLPYGLGWDERDIQALWTETREIALGEFLEETRAQRAQFQGQHAEPLPIMPLPNPLGNNQYSIKEDSLQCKESSKELGGNRAAYLASRLRRDAPAYADALAHGMYASVREACVAAGIITPPPPQIAMSKSRHKAAQAIVAKMGPSYAKALAIELLELVAPVIEEAVESVTELRPPEDPATCIRMLEQVPETVAQPKMLESNITDGDYDHERYYLGRGLCVNGHDYQGTGRSLRYVKGRKGCVKCIQLRSKKKKLDTTSANVSQEDSDETASPPLIADTYGLKVTNE